MHRRALILALPLISLGLGCTDTPNGSVALGGRKLQAVATTGMIADAVRQVGGTRVEVAALMGPGVDPHQYKATAGDLGRLARADLIFYNGLHLEGKMADVFDDLSKRVRTVAVTRTLKPDGDLRPAFEGHEGTHDPHVWFDVTLWMKVVACVRDALAEFDADHAAEYAANAERYLAELTALHVEVKAALVKIPAERRILVTAHDAFFYFGHAYGFREVRGLQGISTASEAGTRDVEELAKFIAEKQVPTIFGESSVPDRNLEAVRQAVRKKYNRDVRILGGELYSDALGPAEGDAGTYIGMVRHNARVIAGVLAP